MEAFTAARWTAFDQLSVSALPDDGAISAAYAMRELSTKEILYIGATGKLLRRLFGNYVGGVGGDTTQRLHKELITKRYIGRVEIGWWPVPDPKAKEEALLAEYKAAHSGKRPPWNRQG